jgi:hypothetical protein
MSYTLGAAARATGKSKATISRAIKSGRLSALRDDAGGYLIEPAELHRVYPATGDFTVAVKQYATPNGTGPEPSSETVALQRLIAEQAETIRDLRARLDTAGEHARNCSRCLPISEGCLGGGAGSGKLTCINAG